MAGLRMEVREHATNDSVSMVAYCGRHCRAHPELASVRPADEDEEDWEQDPCHDAALPYRQPPAATLPDLGGECGRARSLAGWARVRHGTGAGTTTVRGFWLPEEAGGDREESGSEGEGGGEGVGGGWVMWHVWV